MPPSKRRVDSEGVQHRGRVTVRRDTSIPRRGEPSSAGRPRSDSRAPQATPTNRYTPPEKHFRFRPTWHKIVGTIVLVLGLGLIVANEVMLLERSATLLPGGHREVYLLLGVIIAGTSLWWFGWFDRND